MMKLSDRYFAIVLVGLAVGLGCLWQIAIQYDIPVTLPAAILELLLVAWLWKRLGVDRD
jgi:hypothetical protein